VPSEGVTMANNNQFDIYANVPQTYSYKLMELNPELLQVIQENKESLQLKAPRDDSEIVICTKDQTFRVRQRNHSNMVMIARQGRKDDNNFFCAYTKMSSVFEVKKFTGKIDLSGIPLYDGQDSISKLRNSVTIDELKKVSAISDGEFDTMWFSLNGSSYNGIPIVLTDDFITRALHVMIMSVMAESLNFDELSLIEVYRSMEEDSDFSIDIVETILKKFATGEEEPFTLDKTKVATWYGIESLRKHCNSKMIDVSDFLFKWKSDLPPFFECPIDIPLLKGHFVTPLPERIQCISKLELPSDIQSRLKHLFKLQATWELQDIVPFIEEFNLKGVKHENFIMKYARKKKQGKKIFISQR
jgi:sister chromatid cohesion protein DCC1